MFRRLKFINKKSPSQAILTCAEIGFLVLFISIMLNNLFSEIGLKQILFVIYAPIILIPIGLLSFYNIKNKHSIDKTIHYIVLTNILILLLILVFVWR